MGSRDTVHGVAQPCACRFYRARQPLAPPRPAPPQTISAMAAGESLAEVLAAVLPDNITELGAPAAMLTLFTCACFRGQWAAAGHCQPAAARA